MEQEKESIFQKMWDRKGTRAEVRAINALSLKQWQVEFSYPLSVLWFIVMPFLWFIPLILAGTAVTGGAESAALEGLVGTSNWITYIALGSSYTGLAISLMWGTGFALRREQNAGTLETLMTTPMRRDSLVWGSMMHNLQHGGLGVILQLVASVLLFGVTLNWWGIIPALMIVGLSVVGMQGLIFTVVCIVLVAKQGWMIVEFLSSSLLLIAPISYPIAVLPTILQYFSVVSPLTWSVEGFRGFLMDGIAYSGAFNVIVALIILDIVFVIVGGLLFKYTERYVRKRGSLSQF
jgi:ABC-2 type transport system permease protein